MINQNIFKVKFRRNRLVRTEKRINFAHQPATRHNPFRSELFCLYPSIEKNMYDPADDSIDIIYKDGTIKNIAEASDMLNISLLSKKVKKYYLCYQIAQISIKYSFNNTEI